MLSAIRRSHDGCAECGTRCPSVVDEWMALVRATPSRRCRTTATARVVFDNLNLFYNVPEFKLLLPVGLSFYTFQAISYTVDVYKGTAKAEKHFGYFATFVAYWPQLVAGPIQRKEEFLPQLKQNFDFDYERVKEGLIRILYGFFKKVVIADRLAMFVREVYNQPGEHGGFA